MIRIKVLVYFCNHQMLESNKIIDSAIEGTRLIELVYICLRPTKHA